MAESGFWQAQFEILTSAEVANEETIGAKIQITLNGDFFTHTRYYIQKLAPFFLTIHNFS